MCHLENDMFILSCSQDVIEKGEKQPNITIGILVSVVVVFATVLFRILFGGKKPAVSSSQCITALFILNMKRSSTQIICLLQAPVKPAVEAKKPKATETEGAGSSGDKVEKEEDEKEEDEKEETAAPRRRSRRET